MTDLSNSINNENPRDQSIKVDEADILRSAEKRRLLEEADRKARTDAIRAENAEAHRFLTASTLEKARFAKEVVRKTNTAFVNLSKPI